MSLDPRTILVMNIVGSLLMGLSLLVVSRGYLFQIKGVTKWAVATLIQSLGWLFIGALRGVVHDFISIIVGNGLVLLCLGIYFTIIAEFNDKKVRAFWIYLIVGTEVIFLAYFSIIVPNVAARIAIISAFSAVLMYACSFILFAKQSNRPFSHLLTGSMFGITALILTFRCFYSIFIDTNPNQLPFGIHPMQDLSYITFFVASVMLTFCFSLMCNDRYIAQRKQVEEELIKSKALAEELANTKDRFLSNMSHEIRTPLHGILGFTKVLLESEHLPNQQRQLEAIKISGNLLLVLINDILDLAKINSGKIALEEAEFRLSDLMDDILAIFELQIAEKKLNVNLKYDKNIPNILLGDSVRISQILINLINNSTKFTIEGGQINISLNLLEENKDHAIIEFIISDTGVGIENEKLKTLFEPFSHSSYDTTHKNTGTGLGLSIVKRLVDIMKGTIKIESKVNEGTIVKVIVSLKKTKVVEISKDAEVDFFADLKQIGHLKILLAEDNEINQLLAQTILNQFGFEVDTADNGKIAIELLNKKQYDLILMDLKMPELGGLGATRYIREQMQPPKSIIPIIAITADVTQMDIAKYKKAGIDDYVIKPFNKTDLLNKIIRLAKK